ncbi:MAG: hypothetical protein Q7K57_24990 [Burkholderiaceae bacterium]|nr:hypothetical protein [Burkholderiaceae bacterium]
MGLITGFFTGSSTWMWAAGLMFAAGAVGGFKGRDLLADSAQLGAVKTVVKVADKQADKDNKGSTGRVAAAASYQQRTAKLVKEIEHETITAPAPVECNRSPDSMRRYNELVDQANAAR